MSNVWEFALIAVSSTLFVVDPVGAIPVYLVMTAGDPAPKRRSTARRASLAAVAALTLFAAAGERVFQLFQISMPAFRIAGGLILFMVALEMVRGQRTTQEEPSEVAEGKVKEDIAITPLAIPMLAGPASLTTVTILASQAVTFWHQLALYTAIGITGLVTLAVLLLATRLYRWMGRTGVHVLSRLLGLVLAAIAVQFVLDGLREAQVGLAIGRAAPPSVNASR